MVEVSVVPGEQISDPLGLLSERSSPSDIYRPPPLSGVAEEVNSGRLEVLSAFEADEAVGVLVLAYRLSIPDGTRFASVEELYVRPENRRRGAGRTLLDTAIESCSRKGISYIEVQAVNDEAKAFYVNSGFGVEANVEVLSFSQPLMS